MLWENSLYWTRFIWRQEYFITLRHIVWFLGCSVQGQDLDLMIHPDESFTKSAVYDSMISDVLLICTQLKRILCTKQPHPLLLQVKCCRRWLAKWLPKCYKRKKKISSSTYVKRHVYSQSMDYTTQSPSYQKDWILTLPRKIRTQDSSFPHEINFRSRRKVRQGRGESDHQNCAYVLDALPWYCNMCAILHIVCTTGISLLCMDPEFARAWRADLKDV